MSAAKPKKSTKRSAKRSQANKSPGWITTLLGVVFLTMAVSQLITFREFESILYIAGFSNEYVWALLIILAEVLASVVFLGLRVSRLLRKLSAIAALAVSVFWFIFSVVLITSDKIDFMPNIGLFGNYLAVTPGWWTLLQTTTLVLWVLYGLSLVRPGWSFRKA